MSFTGKLNENMRGFYHSKYTVNGEEKNTAVTQLMPTEARSVFPCWDEPVIKATFDVTLVVSKDKVALSNMPVVSDTNIGCNLREVTFDTSPIMSTYLLAFVVGDYDYVETRDEDDVLVRVYTPLGKSEHGRFALDVTAKTLPFYKKYFGISYPLPKVDLIAIADFAAPGMENWGLLTFQETALLVDPKNSSARIKQWVALVVGHELAHQWFGNLVTMEWWTHLWLNEGFAHWIMYLCVDFCFPEYDMWTHFVNYNLGLALEMDALDNSHPVEVEVGHPSEIEEIFDDISYSKGSCVIRMLHNFIGDEDFQKGMNIYLTRHKYQNTCTEDLWNALQEASGKPVGVMMDTWTKQMGFPVLTVSQSHEENVRKIKVSQTKFTANGSVPSKKYLWLVPVTVCTELAPDQIVNLGLMDKESQEFTVPGINPNTWVKLNAGSGGMYRVKYPKEMLETLIPAIRSLSLTPKDRLSLQSDLFALNKAGLVPAIDLLNVVQAYENEKDNTVWANLYANISSFGILLQSTESYHHFEKFVCKVFNKVAQLIGWDAKEGEDCLIPLLRETVLRCLGKYNHLETVAEAKKRFDNHCTGTVILPADLRACVYGTVLVNGNIETYERMLKLYDDADTREEKSRICEVLGYVQDPDIIKEVLKFAISEKVRLEDAVAIIASTTGSVTGRDLAWQFLKDNFKLISNRYEGAFLLSKLLKSTIESFITEEKAQEIEVFFHENPFPAAERIIRQSIENIHVNKAWLSRELKGVAEFLKLYN